MASHYGEVVNTDTNLCLSYFFIQRQAKITFFYSLFQNKNKVGLRKVSCFIKRRKLVKYGHWNKKTRESGT